MRTHSNPDSHQTSATSAPITIATTTTTVLARLNYVVARCASAPPTPHLGHSRQQLPPELADLLIAAGEQLGQALDFFLGAVEFRAEVAEFGVGVGSVARRINGHGSVVKDL